MKTLSVVCCCFLLVLITCGSHHVGEARRHSDRRRRREYNKLLVFGDSFVDAGNLPPGSEKNVTSRAWYYPYGSSDSAHGNAATGRFSDGLVQSDFLAKILGHDESPSPYRLWNDEAVEFDDGVNFAVAGSRVLPPQQGSSSSLPSLSQQINQLRRLVRAGDIDNESDLEVSVALVATSGIHDYASVNDRTSAEEIRALGEDVTDEIAESVRRLHRLGVSKVLVNALPPIGCQPWRSLAGGEYTRCDSKGDLISMTHNTALKQKLQALDDTSSSSSKHAVLVLDLFAIFNNLIKEEGHNNLAPCCDTPGDLNGYCGQEDGRGRRAYTVCRNPASFFYWDYVHPTQAAWKAVMQALEQPIKDFLDRI